MGIFLKWPETGVKLGKNPPKTIKSKVDGIYQRSHKSYVRQTPKITNSGNRYCAYSDQYSKNYLLRESFKDLDSKEDDF